MWTLIGCAGVAEDLGKTLSCGARQWRIRRHGNKAAKRAESTVQEETLKEEEKNLKTPTPRLRFVMICAITQDYHEPAVRSKHGAAYSAANLGHGHAHHKRLISCLHPELLRKLHVVSIVPRGPRLAERHVIMA